MNPKEFYSYIRKKKVFTLIIELLINDNVDFTTHEERMNSILSKFFVLVFTLENHVYPNSANNPNR